MSSTVVLSESEVFDCKIIMRMRCHCDLLMEMMNKGSQEFYAEEMDLVRESLKRMHNKWIERQSVHG